MIAELDAENRRARFEGLDFAAPVQADFLRRVGTRKPGDGREEVWRRMRDWLKREGAEPEACSVTETGPV